METLLKVENLGVHYGTVRALYETTFELGTGSICGLKVVSYRARTVP